MRRHCVLPRLAFFAAVDIAPFTELTWDCTCASGLLALHVLVLWCVSVTDPPVDVSCAHVRSSRFYCCCNVPDGYKRSSYGGDDMFVCECEARNCRGRLY